MSESNSGGGGLGVVGVITVVLVTLKLAQVAPVAGWFWFLVLFGPLLCGIAVGIVFFGLIMGVLGVGAAGAGTSSWMGRRRMRKMNLLADEEEAKERQEQK